MKRMKKVTAMLITASMLFGLCACGDSSADNAGQGAETQTPAQESAADETGSAAEAAAGTKDTVILATSGEPYRFFAQGSQSCAGDDNLALSNIYDCLLFLEPDGSLSPALAESYDVSEDGLTYTFHLRKGVKFHNGEEMTAEDVKMTFDTGAAGPIGSALFVNYDSCDVVDDYTVDIHLTSAYAAFPYGVASRIGGIFCKSYYDEVGEEGYYAAPVGTGPYKFVEYVKGDHTTLEANEDYWRGTPAVKKVVIQTVADTNTQILGLQNGDYDVVRDPAIDVCLRLDDPGVTWAKENSVGRVTMYMNSWKEGPGKDINFRKAIQAAVNKDDVNEAMYSGEAEILDIDVCASYGGCPDAGTYQVAAYDVEAAKQYLADSNYDGSEWKILVQSGSRYENGAKVIQAQLMSIGITSCVVDAKDNASYMEEYKAREWDAIIADNLSSVVDADSLMTYHSMESWWDPAVQGSPRDPEIWELIQEGRATQGDARKPVYAKICDIITEEAYDVPLVNSVVTVAYNTKLKGMQAHCLGNYNFYYYSWE